MSVVDIDGHRPHVVLPVDTGDVHVISVAYLRSWARGEESIDPNPETLRAIVASWLDMLEGDQY